MPPKELYMDFGQNMFQATLLREAKVNEPVSLYDVINSPIAVLPVSRHLILTALVSCDAQHGAFGLIELFTNTTTTTRCLVYGAQLVRAAVLRLGFCPESIVPNAELDADQQSW